MRMTEFYVKAYKSMYPGIAGCGLHDPLAVAVAEDPSLARTERMFVDVELHGEFTRGQTIADRRRTADALHNADVCMDIDRPRFLANFHTALEGAKSVSTPGASIGSMSRRSRPRRPQERSSRACEFVDPSVRPISSIAIAP